MKKIIFIIPLLLLLTGCSSYTELNDLSIVNTLGIDYIDDEYIIKVSVIDINNDTKNIKVYSSKSKDLNYAFQDIYLSSNKKLYLSHIDLLVLTDNTINNKLEEIINNFLKNNEYRNNFQTVIMTSNDFNSFFELKKDAKSITNLIDTNNNETSVVSKKELEDFIRDILIDKNSYLPNIIINEEPLINGYTLIKNNKTYNTLNIKESILLNILTNKTNKTNIDNINIYECDVKIKTNKNKIIFYINLVTDTDNNNNKIKVLKNDLLNLLKEYQQNNYDILKLKELIKKNDYNFYKKEKNLLKNLEFKIKIKNKKKQNYINGGYNEK